MNLPFSLNNHNSLNATSIYMETIRSYPRQDSYLHRGPKGHAFLEQRLLKTYKNHYILPKLKPLEIGGFATKVSGEPNSYLINFEL